MTLSRRARVSLRNFLAFWTGRKRYRTPRARPARAMTAAKSARPVGAFGKRAWMGSPSKPTVDTGGRNDAS
jgi:hypothetical protein